MNASTRFTADDDMADANDYCIYLSCFSALFLLSEAFVFHCYYEHRLCERSLTSYIVLVHFNFLEGAGGMIRFRPKPSSAEWSCAGNPAFISEWPKPGLKSQNGFAALDFIRHDAISISTVRTSL